MSTMTFSDLAAAAVRAVHRVPTVVWGLWIVGIIVGAGVLAFHNQPGL